MGNFCVPDGRCWNILTTGVSIYIHSMKTPVVAQHYIVGYEGNIYLIDPTGAILDVYFKPIYIPGMTRETVTYFPTEMEYLVYITPPECIEGVHEIVEYCPDNITPKRWRDCIAGIWIEDSYTCPSCIEGTHEVIEYCPDNVTKKKWRDCISGAWVESSQLCPECVEGTSEVIEFCSDEITPKRWHVCTGGKWIEHTQPCPECTEDDYEVIEYCPDGSHKRWRKCISGTWTEDSYPCVTCTEGETKCFDLDLYECVSGEWQIKELNSDECKAPPEEPPTPLPEELTLFETIINAIAEILGISPEKAKSVLTIAIVILCIILLSGLI